MDSSNAAFAPSQSPWLRATQPTSRGSACISSPELCPISIPVSHFGVAPSSSAAGALLAAHEAAETPGRLRVRGYQHRGALGHDQAVRSDLPAGTVTLCFTDVEGSTTLLRSLGAEAYAEAL